MGLFSILKRQPKISIIPANWLNSIKGNSYPYSEKDGSNISTVYTCAKILSEDISTIPLNVYKNSKEEGKIPLKDHPLYNLLHYNPNSYTTSTSFFAATEHTRNIKGNAFAYINRGKDGYPKSFTLVHPDLVSGYEVINNHLYYFIDDVVNKTNEPQIVSHEDLLHFRALTSDGIWGITPLEKLRLNLSTTHKAFNTIDSFYDNNATTPKALKTTIPESQNMREWIKRIETFVEEKVVGPHNAGKFLLLPAFTELQDIAINFADAEFIATIRFNVDQIAALYRIPAHLLGNYGSPTFSNMEHLQLNYKNSTLRPILRMYRQELESKLLTHEERNAGISIEFNTNAFVETDSKTRIDNFKTLFGMGAITPNDICKLEGFEAYEGGENHFILTQLQAVEAYNKKLNALNDEINKKDI